MLAENGPLATSILVGNPSAGGPAGARTTLLIPSVRTSYPSCRYLHVSGEHRRPSPQSTTASVQKRSRRTTTGGLVCHFELASGLGQEQTSNPVGVHVRIALNTGSQFTGGGHVCSGPGADIERVATNVSLRHKQTLIPPMPSRLRRRAFRRGFVAYPPSARSAAGQPT